MTPATYALSNRTRTSWSGRLVRVSIVAALLLTYLVVRASDDTALGQVGGTTSLTEIDPFRLVDTRIDLGVVRVDANTYKVRTRPNAAIPEGAEALAVTIAVTNATAPGFLVAYPSSESRPLASNVNYEPGQTISAGAVVTLNEWGNFEIFLKSPADVVVDVTGAFMPAAASRAGRFVAITPDRLVDTRSTTPMTANQTTTVRFPSVVPDDATAAIVTLTSTLPNHPGYFTAYANGPRPLTSTLNLSTPNSTRASTAIVPISNRSMQVYSSTGGNLVVDLIGYFTGPSAELSTSGLFVPTVPKRRVDTRDSATMQTTETRGFDASGGVALGALTMIGQGAPGWAALFANGTSQPATSSINLSDSSVISNLAVSRVSNYGISVYSSAGADYVFDQFGYFVDTPVKAELPPAPKGPPAAQSPSSSGCTVSSLLVPSCGVWFGATTPPRDDSNDYARGLAEYEAVAQNTPDILHFYKTGAQKFPNGDEIAMANRPGKQRSILLYNWKPSGSDTWRQIAQGGADAEIATVAASIKKYPHKLFLNIYHEPEDNVRTSSSSGMTPADYADMYRHVVTKLRSSGVTNAVYVWNTMGFSGWEQYLDGLYPGDNYVDWMCYDPYAQDNRDATIERLINRDSASLNWPGYYEWATAKAPGKPLMLCEWGVDLTTNSDPASLLDVDMGRILAKYPMLKGMVHWHKVGVGNYRLDDQTTKGRALGAAYRELAAQPIFNAMSPNLAP